jgi:agmatinase
LTGRPHHHLPEDFSADDLHERYGPEARYAVAAEGAMPTTKWEEEVARGLELGLPGADSIVDRRIPTFSRGELPHFAGINTFLKAPYVEDVRTCGEYDIAILGAPFDGGTTYRPGTRFGPQGIRRISALYGSYSFELGVDLRESVTMADLGDVFTIPGNIEKTFDQISKAVSHVYGSGTFPVVLGGDHSIGYPTMRGVAEHLTGKLGIIHFDRHVDMQETDLDERMHTTPYFHATNLPNVPPENLVQIGIGEWQAPRPASRPAGSARQRSYGDRLRRDGDRGGRTARPRRGLGRRRGGLALLRRRLPGCRVRSGHRPARARRLPAREVLKFIQLIAEGPLAGIEVVECSPPYDNADITSLIATRVSCDTLGCLVRAGHLPKR